MEEFIISFKTAKLAKEKGFDEMFNYVFSKGHKFPQRLTKSLRNSYYTKLLIDLPDHEDIKHMFIAPTQSLLQKWLREEHRIFIFIEPVIDHNNIGYIGRYWNKTPMKQYTGIWFFRYEDALEQVLEIALSQID